MSEKFEWTGFKPWLAEIWRNLGRLLSFVFLIGAVFGIDWAVMHMPTNRLIMICFLITIAVILHFMDDDEEEDPDAPEWATEAGLEKLRTEVWELREWLKGKK